ncbi:MAG TPA: amidohydrolase family protein [Tepidisphaeraceae bacterium]|nr:amidohydrolase family protein [Tepidisphaeraceae bacterium]
MILDVHVHVCAATPGHGSMSQELLDSLPFRFMRWRLGLGPYHADTERELEAKLSESIDETEKLDAVVALAFDAVHDNDGNRDVKNTHLYVTNDYGIELARKYPKMLFGCSVHPYRKDAVAEVERCAKAGAVLMKWLPNTQCFNPSDERCFPVYEALAHHKLTLLSHTGGEKSLPVLDRTVGDPALLEPAVKRGVTVIAAHCGTRSGRADPDYLPTFMRMAREHEHFYGDTSALNLPTRSYAYRHVLGDQVVREKLVHGSDWPILPVPPLRHLGLGGSWAAWRERNWLRRDVLIKQRIGFDDAYWHRAAKVLGVSRPGTSVHRVPAGAA